MISKNLASRTSHVQPQKTRARCRGRCRDRGREIDAGVDAGIEVISKNLASRTSHVQPRKNQGSRQGVQAGIAEFGFCPKNAEKIGPSGGVCGLVKVEGLEIQHFVQ